LQPGTPEAPEAIARAEASAIDKLTASYDLRLHVVGDCRTIRAAKILASAVKRYITRAVKPVAAWTYTHSWRTIPRATWGSISVLASCETPNDIALAHERGYATALVVSCFESKRLYRWQGVAIIPCPAQTRHDVQCVDCKLCFDSARLHQERLTIGFEAHGKRERMVRERLIQLQPV